jgi:mRNA interferase MazF
MTLKQKELVLLPYPFSDQEGSKVRPALIISNNSFNKKSEDCIMIPLTTVIKEVPYSVLINQENLTSGKLLKPSRIRIDKIFTIRQSLVRMKIGVINDSTFKEIKSEISKIF